MGRSVIYHLLVELHRQVGSQNPLRNKNLIFPYQIVINWRHTAWLLVMVSVGEVGFFWGKIEGQNWFVLKWRIYPKIKLSGRGQSPAILMGFMDFHPHGKLSEDMLKFRWKWPWGKLDIMGIVGKLYLPSDGFRTSFPQNCELGEQICIQKPLSCMIQQSAKCFCAPGYSPSLLSYGTSIKWCYICIYHTYHIL